MKKIFSYILTLICIFLTHLPPYLAEAKQFQVHNSHAEFSYQATLNSKNGSPSPNFIGFSGVYVADYNNDNWPDILVTGGESPTLFRNRKGVFQIETKFNLDKQIATAHFLDYDTDGWTDLILIPRKGRIILFENSRGDFERQASLDEPRLKEGIGVTSGDFNRDRCPDLFVLEYSNLTKKSPKKLKRKRLGFDNISSENDNGRRNHLLLGNCQSFTPVNNSVFDRNHWSLATSAADFNGNGYQDIHVANDFFRDSLYINQQDGTFEHRYFDETTNRNAMSSEILNVNNDTSPDIFVSNIFLPRQSPWSKRSFITDYAVNARGHNLLINKANSTFKDRASSYNVKRGGWGWSVTNGDFDNDFKAELIQLRQDFLKKRFLKNLKLRQTKNARFFGKYSQKTSYSIEHNPTPDLFELFKDWMGYPRYWDRSGKSFKPLSPKKTGLERLDGRAVSQIDFDRDGDLDLIAAVLQGSFRIIENQTIKDKSTDWLKIHVEKAFIGGTLTVENGSKKQKIPISTRSDFLSQEPSVYHFGSIKENKVTNIKLNWNQGKTVHRSVNKSNEIIKLSPFLDNDTDQ